MRGEHRGAHGLRHVQGGRSRHAHHRPPPAPQGAAGVPGTFTAELMLCGRGGARADQRGLPAAARRVGAPRGRRMAACWPRIWSRARDQPPGAVSAMDGYAVRAADLAGGRRRASADRQRAGRQPLRGRARAGRGGAHLHRRPAAGGRRCGRAAGERDRRGRSDPARGARSSPAPSSGRPASTSSAASWRCRRAAA